MPGPLYPKFQRNSVGELLLTDSEAGRPSATGRPAWSPPLSAEVIEREAKQRVRARQGDLTDEKDVLGEYILQSGKYRGKCFRWLLENVPGYVGWLVGQIINDEGKEDKSSAHQIRNKRSLKRYVQMFEEGRILIQKKRDEKSTKSTTTTTTTTEGPSRFKTLLIGRQLPTNVLKKKAQTLFSPAKVKPNIPLTRTPVVDVPPPVLVTPQVATPASASSEDRELVAFLEQMESTEVSEPPLPAPNPSSVPLLYQGWKSTLPKVDHQWISKTFFRINPTNNKIEFRSEQFTQLWHTPPPSSQSASVRNKVDRFFTHRLFLWMPVNIWGVRLLCPHRDETGESDCNGVLTRAGIHQKTRMVLDVDCHYIIAAEYLRCSSCKRKVISWAHGLVRQLDNDHQMQFPCILTARLACDRKVVALLRNRGLGNSSSMVCRQLEEEHGDTYLRQSHHYLTECRKYKVAALAGLVVPSNFDELPEMIRIPRHRWLMKVYQLDVLQRLEYIKASITSQFGDVLKIDSTKKITKKLAGKSASTAMWATNVGNEHGQILMTVLTTGEGVGLKPMIDGIIRRYQNADVTPPHLLYVDRDCCGSSAVSKYFESWPILIVRLDIWHFMRRLALGCTTDAHPLYGVFMGRVSHCIFRWEEEDVNLLKKAKRLQLISQHISNPSDSDVMSSITKDELALHCRRVTRGVEEVTRLLSDLIKSMDGDNGLDILGVPLIDSIKMQDIWIQQSRHVGCIQDPEGIQLYTRVGTVRKGGVVLPTYRCARGSTSLESFHLHMARFIPGTLASDVNFQVYLLDGVFRWNEDRKRDALSEQGSAGPLSYDGPLQQAVKKLALELLGREICPNYTAPIKYTGELLGLEYLFSQSSGGDPTGSDLNYSHAAEAMEEDTHDDEDEEIDEGFVESTVVQDVTVPMLLPATPKKPAQPPKSILSIPCDDEYRALAPGRQQLEQTTELYSPGITSTQSSSPRQLQGPLEVSDPVMTDDSIFDDSDLGPDNIPGYTQVLKLASFLVSLTDQPTPLTTKQSKAVIELWENLSEYDKRRTRFPQRAASSSGSGKFKSPKKQVALGVPSIERAILGPNSTRANWPDCNRYVEAIVQKLVEQYPSDRRSKSTQTYMSRWMMIKDAYSRIQGLVIGNKRIMVETEIQLPSLNIKTIQQWYNKTGKARDLKILIQGITLPDAPMVGTGAPPPKDKRTALPVGEGAHFQFPDAPDTSGMAKLKKRQRLQTPPPTTTFTRPILPATTLLPRVTAVLPPAVPSQVILPPVVGVTGPSRPKRKYSRTSEITTCPKCGQERTGPAHQQYMGYRYCGNTVSVPFSDWRADLQSRAVARKGKK